MTNQNAIHPESGGFPRPAAPSALAGIVLVALTLVILGFLVLSLVKPLTSFDAGWNIRMGEWIWENGRLPDEDPLLFTSIVPTPDLDSPSLEVGESQATKDTVLRSHWLGQVAFYAAWSVDPIVGPIVLRTLLFALTVLGILATLRSLGMPWAWSLAGAMVAMVMLQGYVLARPSLFSIALLAWSMLLWVRSWVTGRAWYAWAAVTVLALWAQLHAGFLYGVVLALGWTLCLAGERLLAGTMLGGDKPWQRSPELGARVRLGHGHLALLALAAALVPVFAYPPGLGGLLGFARDLASMDMTSVEMTPIDFGEDPLFFALAGGSLVVAVARWRYLPLPLWAVLLGATAAPFLARRNMALFVAVGLPVLILGFHQLVDLVKRRRSHSGIEVALGLLVLGFGAQYLLANPVIVKTTQPFSWYRTSHPVALAEFVRSHTPPGQPMHPYHIGGYLELAVPEVKWFADGRYYKPRFMQYASDAEKDPVLRQKLVQQYGIDWMILPVFSGHSHDTQLSMTFVDVAADPEWLPVALVQGFGLFVRKGERTADYLAAYTMSFSDWHSALLRALSQGGRELMARQESRSETWLALYLTLAGYLGGQGPNRNIASPESLLAGVSPSDPGYGMSQEILDKLPVFQRRVAAMLAQLPGGEAYAVFARFDGNSLPVSPY